MSTTPNFLKYASKTDITLAIDVLKVAIDKTKGTYTHDKIKPSLNRVIFELEAMQ